MVSVYIPVQNSEEEVRVVLDQLPRDASDILDILKAEQAPLDLWFIIAVYLLSLSLSVFLCLSCCMLDARENGANGTNKCAIEKRS